MGITPRGFAAKAVVWLALASPLLILGACFASTAAVLAAVRGVPQQDLAAAMDAVAALPITLGFTLVLLLTWRLARTDGHTLTTLGWRAPSGMDLLAATVVGAAVLGFNALLFHPWVRTVQPAFDPTLGAMSLPLAVGMMGLAAAAEDTLFRGYALVELRARHNTAVALLASALFYAPLAGAQGGALVVWALGFGLVLAGLRLWRNNLWAVWWTHVVVVLGPKVLAGLG